MDTPYCRTGTQHGLRINVHIRLHHASFIVHRYNYNHTTYRIIHLGHSIKILLITMKYEHLYLYNHKTVEIHLFMLNFLSAHCVETDIVRIFQKVDH